MTADLTRARIETIVRSYDALHHTDIVTAITQLLRQLDAANARADAAAEQMRERCVAELTSEDWNNCGCWPCRGHEERRMTLELAVEAIAALPLHEEPTNDAGIDTQRN